MRISIGKRSYPMGIMDVIKRPMLFKAYNAYAKRKVINELVDYIFCHTVKKKSVHYLYWNFVHETAKQQVNLGSSGADLRQPIEEALHAEKLDVAKLKKGLDAVAARAEMLLDQDHELAFSQSPEIQEFALDQVRLKPRDAITKLDIYSAQNIANGKQLVLHLAFGRKKEARNLAAYMIKKTKGKKPSVKKMTKYMKELEKAI